MSFSKLNTDIIHEILTALPDFVSLCAALRTCRIFDDVFTARPESITRAILSKSLGLADLAAARMAQYYHDNRNGGDPMSIRSEKYFTELPVDLEEAQDLVRRGRVVMRLEDHFSFEYVLLLPVLSW